MALIDRVARAELAAGGVPDQLEQLQALLRLQLGTAVVAVHQPPRLAVAQVGGARDGDQRGAAEGAFQQLADPLPDLRHLDAQGIGVLQARHRRPGGVALRVAGHGGGQRLQQVLQGDQLAEGSLYPAEALVPLARTPRESRPIISSSFTPRRMPDWKLYRLAKPDSE